MEPARAEGLGKGQEREPPKRVLLTYYQGDINSVVDEHFARALKRVTLPKDLSIRASLSKEQHINKPRTKGKVIKQEPTAQSAWSPSGLDWPKSTFPSTSSLTQLGSAESAVGPQGVIMGPGGLSSAVWSYPTRGGLPPFDLPPMLYSPVAAGQAETASGSFLSMLHMERPAGGAAMVTKTEPGADWSSASAYREAVSNRMSLDSGAQRTEKAKDVYWY